MTLTIPIQISAFYAALAALWLILMGLLVVRERWRARVGIGTGGDSRLEIAQRIHGNAAEWLPMSVVLILVLELLAAPIWLLHALGVALVLGRVLHALGLKRSRGPSWERSAGLLLTWLTLLVGSGACMLEALAP